MDAMEHKSLRFGSFRLDAARESLLRDGVELRLRPQSFAVLRYLAENANRLVTKEELFRAVWGDAVVTDDSLTQCLVDVRRALGDERHELIRTVPRRGYLFEMEVSEAADAAPAGDAAPVRRRPGLRLRWLAAGGLAVLAAFGVWSAVGWLAGEGDGAPAPGNTIAVLPFADMSEAGDQRWFADGMAEEILNLLARDPALRVVARTSSFSFRGNGADVRAIGGALDTAYLLEGSVRRDGERVRVTAQLIEVAGGAHAWSEQYDRKLGEMFAVQTEIAQSVAIALRGTLATQAQLAARPPADPKAYEHFLQALFLHNRRGPGDLALAERHFQQALEIDPQHAPAWAGLAGTQLARIFEGETQAAEGLEAMRRSVAHALDLDPELPEAQVRAAQYYGHAGLPEEARRHFERAEALGPNSALVLASAAGRRAARGSYGEAVAFSARALALDPLGAVVRSNHAGYLALAARYEEALRESRRAQELSPRNQNFQQRELLLLALLGRHEEALAAAAGIADPARREQGMAIAYRGLGRNVEARSALLRLRQRSHPELPLMLAEVHAQWGEPDRAFELFPEVRRAQRAVMPTPGAARLQEWLLTSPLLRPLHGDPRWEEILAEARR